MTARSTPWPWTKEIEAHLQRLLAQAATNPKISFSVIANRLNEKFGTAFSRNAVAGRMKRLALKMPAARVVPATIAAVADVVVKPKIEAKPKREAKVVLAAPAAKPVPKQQAVAPVAEQLPEPVTLLRREIWQCRWPVNDGGPFLFCGVRKGAHDPNYCPHHRTVATGRRLRTG